MHRLEVINYDNGIGEYTDLWNNFCKITPLKDINLTLKHQGVSEFDSDGVAYFETKEDLTAFVLMWG